MNGIGRAGRRLRNLWRRAAVERDMDEEMRFHLEMEVEERVRAGMTPDEARRTARRDFGATERFQDEGRDARGIGAMENLSQDVRFTLRTLRRNPSFAAIAVLTLALGIGASTAIFSVVNGVLLRPLPYAEPDRLVAVQQVFEGGGEGSFSHPNFVDVRARSRSFEALAEYAAGFAPVTVGDEGLRLLRATVSPEFFGVLRLSPSLGRLPTAEEWATSAPVAVVSEGFWRQQLGGTRELGSRPIRIGGEPVTVIGVLPADARFPGEAALWTPQPSMEDYRYRTGHNWQVIGRLRGGVAPAATTRELHGIARELKAQYGDDTHMESATATPLHDTMVGGVRPALLVLLGAAGLLLLIACANVVNLLLTRMAARRRELAVRLALGAGRGRLARQFVAESLTLTLAGGVLGTLLALAGVRALLALEPGRLPRLAEIRVDGAALGFALAVSLAAAVGMGLIVALRATDADLRETLAEGTRGGSAGVATHRIRSVLAAGQVALTVVLLVGAGLLARSFLRLVSVDPGFRTEGALTMEVLVPWTDDADGALANLRLHAELRERLLAIPGVTEAGSVNLLPLGGGDGSNGTFLKMDGDEQFTSFEDFRPYLNDPARSGDAHYRVASAGYFRSIGIPLLRGRLPSDAAGPDAVHEAVVSRSLAEAEWEGGDPIGQLVQYGGMDGDLRLFRVVGVVGDVRDAGLEVEPRPIFYAGVAQRPLGAGGSHNYVLLGGDPRGVAAAARAAVRAVDPELPLRFRSLDEVYSASLSERRFSLLLLGVFAGVALLLAVAGLYGIIAYLVSQRTREIGIRLALGARAASVVAMVVRGGVMLALGGVAVGMVAALATSRLLSTLLYGVGATDPVTFVAVPLLLIAVSALASWLPARRTTRVDPMVALRAE